MAETTASATTQETADVIVIGRGSRCDVTLPVGRVSRRHCLLLCHPGGAILEDLRSRNGTWVRGRRVERAVLETGDHFAVGRVRLRLADDGRPIPVNLPTHVTPLVAAPIRRGTEPREEPFTVSASLWPGVLLLAAAVIACVAAFATVPGRTPAVRELAAVPGAVPVPMALDAEAPVWLADVTPPPPISDAPDAPEVPRVSVEYEPPAATAPPSYRDYVPAIAPPVKEERAVVAPEPEEIAETPVPQEPPAPILDPKPTEEVTVARTVPLPPRTEEAAALKDECTKLIDNYHVPAYSIVPLVEKLEALRSIDHGVVAEHLLAVHDHAHDLTETVAKRIRTMKRRLPELRRKARRKPEEQKPLDLVVQLIEILEGQHRTLDSMLREVVYSIGEIETADAAPVLLERLHKRKVSDLSYAILRVVRTTRYMDAVPKLISTLNTSNKELRKEVGELLRDLTGKNFRDHYVPWKQWHRRTVAEARRARDGVAEAARSMERR